MDLTRRLPLPCTSPTFSKLPCLVCLFTPLACISSLLWSGIENRLLRSFGCLLILVLEVLLAFWKVPLQETLNAPNFSYEVCMHAPSPVRQTNKVSLQLLVHRRPPVDTPSLRSTPPSVYASSHLSSISYTPISHMPRPHSPCKPSSVCDVAYICQPHATWTIRVAVHEFADSRPRSRLASAIASSPQSPCRRFASTTADCPPIESHGSQHPVALCILCTRVVVVA
jgi:hypothetical protein